MLLPCQQKPQSLHLMKLHQKIFEIGLLTAVIVPHLYEKGYNLKVLLSFRLENKFQLSQHTKYGRDKLLNSGNKLLQLSQYSSINLTVGRAALGCVICAVSISAQSAENTLPGVTKERLLGGFLLEQGEFYNNQNLWISTENKELQLQMC